MKYPAAIYAKAFLEIKPDLKKFLMMVDKNGDFARIDKIVEAIESQSTKERGGHVVELEMARDVDQKLVDKLRKKFTVKDHIRTKISPNLIAGVRITIDGERELNQSLQRKLTNLWHTK